MTPSRLAANVISSPVGGPAGRMSRNGGPAMFSCAKHLAVRLVVLAAPVALFLAAAAPRVKY
jgi:hypothetical protein